MSTIQKLRPDIFVKGSEFKDLKDLTGNVKEEHDAVVAAGERVLQKVPDLLAIDVARHPHVAAQPRVQPGHAVPALTEQAFHPLPLARHVRR